MTNPTTFLARREATHRPERILWYTMAVPLFIASGWFWDALRFTTGASFAGALVVAIIAALILKQLLGRTLIQTRSRQLRTMSQFWALYTGLAVVTLLVEAGWEAYHAVDAGDVLRAVVDVRMPLAEVAPAILLGPLVYAYLRDAYDLAGPSHKAALRNGITAIFCALAVPVVVYLAGAWYGALDTRVHLFWFNDFRRAVVAMAVAIGSAAVLAWMAILVDTDRTRRLEDRLLSEGIA